MNNTLLIKELLTNGYHLECDQCHMTTINPNDIDPNNGLCRNCNNDNIDNEHYSYWENRFTNTEFDMNSEYPIDNSEYEYKWGANYK